MLAHPELCRESISSRQAGSRIIRSVACHVAELHLLLEPGSDRPITLGNFKGRADYRYTLSHGFNHFCDRFLLFPPEQT